MLIMGSSPGHNQAHPGVIIRSIWGHREGHFIGLGVEKLLTSGWFRVRSNIDPWVPGEYRDGTPGRSLIAPGRFRDKSRDFDQFCPGVARTDFGR